jgi:UDP-N-acetylmuramoyl-tripeptide--D-alanyl-D-alanine ligase
MMKTLWTSKVVLEVTGGVSYGPKWAATGISFDSRSINPGDLFFALTEGRRDGHEFVFDALVKGAAAVIVEKLPDNREEDQPFLLVESVFEALQKLAMESRSRSSAEIIAVTGSVGKTGTKDALAMVLANFDEVHATTGNLNNHLGVPLSLAKMPKTTRFGVFELGMNHAREIKVLSKLVKPNLAIITNVNPVHLEHFANEKSIALAKAEIFLGMDDRAKVVLNLDNKWGGLLVEKAINAGISQITTFGRNAAADVRLCALETNGNGSFVEIEIAGTRFQYVLDAVGEHLAYNTVGIMACIHALGLEIQVAADFLRHTRPARGRGEQREIFLSSGGSLKLIDESYNASPASMRASFSVLGLSQPLVKGRRIAVIGDMLELGRTSSFLHADLFDDLIAAKPDLVVTIGALMKKLHNKLPKTLHSMHADNSIDIANSLFDELRAGDVVLVKGSLGSNMSSIILAIEGAGLQSKSFNKSATTGNKDHVI